ncbi:MAG: adenylyl-sulfate kinase [Flavobacteriaceae bacterium]|jgi:adenylyl-sulfate kinase
MKENNKEQLFEVSRTERRKHKKHNSFVLWFTGLSGAGKSVIADKVEQRLLEMGVHTYILDGDNLRRGVNRDLGFSKEDRSENIRRVGEMSALFVDAGLVVVTSFISPFQSDRKMARDAVGTSRFIEVFINTPLEVCEQRDPKGLYKKVRDGIITDFTGISSPYEAPTNPDIEINTVLLNPEQAADEIVTQVRTKLALE